MKNIRRTLSRALILLPVLIAVPNPLLAQETARVEVILVEANNSGKGVDNSLRPYAATLQRLFRFNSYKALSKRSIRAKVPGGGSTSLPGGGELSLTVSGSDGRGLVAEAEWRRGGKRLLHTRIQLRSGSPAVLGGPRTRDGSTQLLILTLR